jgi:hypothetical protein
MGGCRHQIFVLWPEGQFIGKACRIDVGPEGRVLGDIFNTFSVVIDDSVKIFEALKVILFGHDPFHSSLLLKSRAHRA